MKPPHTLSAVAIARQLGRMRRAVPHVLAIRLCGAPGPAPAGERPSRAPPELGPPRLSGLGVQPLFSLVRTEADHLECAESREVESGAMRERSDGMPCFSGRLTGMVGSASWIGCLRSTSFDTR